MNFADILVESKKKLQKKAAQVQKKNGKKDINLELLRITWNRYGLEMLLTGTLLRKLNCASMKTI